MHTLARFVEEDIDFEDNAGEGEPDLRVRSGDDFFPLEIKLPTTNAVTSLNKALKQFNGKPSVVAICLDSVLSTVADNDKEAVARVVAGQLRERLGDSETAVVLEFYVENSSITRVEWWRR